MPEWVLLPRPDNEVVPVASPVPWAPELAFLAGQPPGATHADALAIQRFLSNGGRSRCIVPSRERSIELFGDEKRLDALLKSPLFAPGCLSLDTLRCRSLAVPLALQDGPSGTFGRPCLVIENHHTWWSFCEWNARVGVYSAVVYGSGSAFGREQVRFLIQECERWGTRDVHYFGDLDARGLQIPSIASVRALADGVRIVPAVSWIRQLLTRAEDANLPSGAPIIVSDSVLQWLPTRQQVAVRSWFARGVRIPQELVGTDSLAELKGVPSVEDD